MTIGVRELLDQGADRLLSFPSIALPLLIWQSGVAAFAKTKEAGQVEAAIERAAPGHESKQRLPTGEEKWEIVAACTSTSSI